MTLPLFLYKPLKLAFFSGLGVESSQGNLQYDKFVVGFCVIFRFSFQPSLLTSDKVILILAYNQRACFLSDWDLKSICIQSLPRVSAWSVNRQSASCIFPEAARFALTL